MAKVTTFYSYKGGSGRSMTMANVAWALATNGERVLAIDWDLEAPGLHRYFHPFLDDPEQATSEGLVDRIWAYIEDLSNTAKPGHDRKTRLALAVCEDMSSHWSSLRGRRDVCTCSVPVAKTTNIAPRSADSTGQTSTPASMERPSSSV